MHWDSDSSSLISDSAIDSLPDPPSGISRKLETPLVLKFIRSFHESNVSFVDQIQQRKASMKIFFGYGYD